MSLKMTLFLVAMAVAANAFALPLKSTPYSGVVQEQHVSPQDTQVVGAATLSEINRATNSQQDAELLLHAEPANNTQGILQNAEFVILSLKVSRSSLSGSSVLFPAVLNLQKQQGIDGQEPAFKAFQGSCATELEPRSKQAVVCHFSRGINPFVRLYIEIQ